MPAKPAKEGQEGFDAARLVKEEGAEEVVEPDDEQEDEPGDEDTLSLDELDTKLRAEFEKAIADEGDDDDEEPGPEGGDDADEADVRGRLKKAEEELRQMRVERTRKAKVDARVDAAKEVYAVVQEFKLTKAEMNTVVKYFERNPDLEGVVPFRAAAIRVLGLGDRASKPASDGRNGGSPRGEGAQHIVTRGGGGPSPRREAFKPTPERGNYANVTAALLNGGLARKLVTTD